MTSSVEIVMRGVEQALCEAFNLPSAPTEASLKKNFNQLIGRETVKIIVGKGENAKEFVVHKDLLMGRVSFFKKMFSSGFLESSMGTATLPEDDPEAFEVLVEWVYRSSLESIHGAGHTKLNQADLALSTVVLAEKYMIPELGDFVMNFLVKAGEDLMPTVSQMTTLYKNTPFKSKARLYAASAVAWALTSPEKIGVSNAAIHTAFQDSDLLLDAIKEVRGTSGTRHRRAHEYPVCDYHNHATAPTCPYEGGQRQTFDQGDQRKKRKR